MSRRKQARPIRMQDECGPNGKLGMKDTTLSMPSVGRDDAPLKTSCEPEQTNNESGDSTSSCSEDDVLVPDMRELSSASYPEPHPSIQDLTIKQHNSKAPDPIDSHKTEAAAPASLCKNVQHTNQENPNNTTANGAAPTSAAAGPSAASTTFAPSHVTLEALENTKVAVAQFAATALANGADEASLKELAMLQSTLFTLQHQQVFQIQLIHQLQSQVTESRSIDKTHDIKFAPIISKCVDRSSSLSHHESTERESKHPRIQTAAHQEDVKPESKTNASNQQYHVEIEDKTVLPAETSRPHSPIRVPSPMRSPMCHISTSFANSIITNHEHPPSANAPNSLEMLQKRAQEVLDSASQGLLSSNLVDELAFRKEKLAALDVNAVRGENLFKHRCRYCGKVFGSDSALQIHIRSHTGERPFQCHVCGSRFTTKGNLKVHYQRHTQTYSYMQMSNSVQDPNEQYRNSMLLAKPEELDGEPSTYASALDRITHLVPEQSHSIFSSVLNHQEQDAPADFSQITQSKLPITSIHEQRSSPMPRINLETDNNHLHRKMVVTRSQQSNHHIQRYIDASSEEEEVEQEEDEERPVNVLVSTKLNSTNLCIAPQHKSTSFSPIQNQSTSKPTETTKLQSLVDNIEHTITEANQCPVCNRILPCKQTLDMHMHLHAEDGLFKCGICGRTFGTADNLKIHLNAHKIQSEMRSLYQCPICRKHFTNSSYLEQHVKGHASESKDTQDRRYAYDEDAYYRSIEHTKQDAHHKYDAISEDEETVDKKAGTAWLNRIGDQQSRELAAARHHDKSMIDALKTARNTPSSNSVSSFPQQSPISNDGALDLTPRSIPISSPTNGCVVTDQTHPQQPSPIGMFPSFPFLSQSSMSASGPLSSMAPSNMPTGPFNPLGLAGMSPRTHNNSLMDAMQHGYHFLNDLVPGIRGNTTCNICFKTFACHSALEIHYRSHTKERPFKCGVCERGFSTKGNMKQHMLTHKIRDMPQNMFSGTAQSPSSDSGQSFASHVPPKDTITYMGDQSPSPVNYHTGMKPHQNTYPESASSPDKEYHRKFYAISPHSYAGIAVPPSELRRSTPDSEDGTSPHASSTPIAQELLNDESNNCAESYSPSDEHEEYSNALSSLSPVTENYKEHASVEQEKKSLSEYRPESASNDAIVNNKHLCETCRKNFSSSSALQIHSRTHTGDRPFRCTFCQKSFTTKGNLKVHMGTHMWTSGASRRGRRMSLELPMNRPPLPLTQQDSDFLQRRPDLFYPYLPSPFLNGIHQQLSEMTASARSSPNGVPPMPVSNQDQKYNVIGHAGQLHHLPQPAAPPNRLPKSSRRAIRSKRSHSGSKRWSAAHEAIPNTTDWMSRRSRSSSKKVVA